MRYVHCHWLLGAALALSGCASGVLGPLGDAAVLPLAAEPNAPAGRAALASDEGAGPLAEPGGFATISDEPASPEPERDAKILDEEPVLTIRYEATGADQPDAGFIVEERAAQPGDLEREAETIITPPPAPRSPFRAGVDEAQLDRFARRVVDVPIDIRPTEGVLPADLAARKFADEPTIDETYPSGEPADVFCSYTPWTICYRPLYFEDIPLERYGRDIGYLQSGLSGARFFGSVAALPYKMTRRPPRTCQCSNGFSRCGDCPLPDYGQRKFQWDASLVEAAIVTGFIFILP